MSKILNIIFTLLIITPIIFILYIPNYINYFKSILWAITTAFIIINAIYLNKKTNFISINPIQIIKALSLKQKKEVFRSLTITLGSKIGVGSLAGIAIAIHFGGYGTILWLWLSTLLLSVNTYAENYLYITYNKTTSKIQGPSKYITNGLKNNYLAVLYSLLIIITYSIGFIPIQSNTITTSIQTIINIKPDIISIIISIVCLFIFTKNEKNISKINNKIVPLMLLSYILIGMYLIVKHITIIPIILKKIIIEAYKPRTALFSVIIIGIQRTIFATESGTGLSSLSLSNINKEAREIALIQVLGVYITSLIICTITAFIIFITPTTSINSNNLNGIEIITNAFRYHFGNIGEKILIILVILFAISTITSGYYYIKKSFTNLMDNKSKIFNTLLLILLIISIYKGSNSNSLLIWNIIDIFLALITIINSYSIYKLRKEVK